MINCEDFAEICKKHGFTFFSGVPDSTFKSWMSSLENSDLTNVIAVNECEATGICAGYHLSTGNIGVLYMQNDGFGKTVNPLTSLCDPEVYNIPVLLMIGWRGEPGKKDAPQHKKMGEILLPLLDLLEIPYKIIPDDISKTDDILKKAKKYMQNNNKPYAIIIRKGIFEKSSSEINSDSKKMGREEALREIMEHLDGDEIIVSTTGKLSRELYEYRVEENDGFERDFYNIGAMGCAQSIALGIALQKKEKEVFVFDGDGSVLMQMGGLATIGQSSPKNFNHIIFDNRAYDSTGGQPTSSNTVDFKKVALACNYNYGKIAKNEEELEKNLQDSKNIDGPGLLVVEVKKGARDDLGRPEKDPVEYKIDFMNSLGD
ncbi:MAG: phosphonopyruvate decarboxylase [Thermoplasmata archaeon]